MGLTVNKDVLQGQWRQWKGELKRPWAASPTTSSTPPRATTTSSGALQERYGHTKQRATEEVDDFVRWIEERIEGERPSAR
jgi:uncharacterized protein YjbJ (UPF0337 family)